MTPLRVNIWEDVMEETHQEMPLVWVRTIPARIIRMLTRSVVVQHSWNGTTILGWCPGAAIIRPEMF